MTATTHLRKVGGSLMLSIPPVILELLELQAGSEIALEIEGDKLIIQKTKKTAYTLDALLAECDFDAAENEEDALWLSSEAVGREIL